jgi:hypothetical protein
MHPGACVLPQYLKLWEDRAGCRLVIKGTRGGAARAHLADAAAVLQVKAALDALPRKHIAEARGDLLVARQAAVARLAALLSGGAGGEQAESQRGRGRGRPCSWQ